MYKIIVEIETDSPNADGQTYRVARELFALFTGKPRFNTRVVARVVQTDRRDGRILPPQEQIQGSRLGALRSRSE